MSPKEIDEFFAPAEAHVEAVMAWLVGSGISRERLAQSGNKQVSFFVRSNYLRISPF